MELRIKKNNSHWNRKGISLVEVLIATFIFATIILASVSTFSSIYSARKKARDLQVNLENVRTAIEVLSKNVRMSNNLGPNGSTTVLRMFNNSQGVCMIYQFIGGALRYGTGANAGTPDNPDCSGVATSQDIIPSGVVGSFMIDQTVTTLGSEHIGKITIRVTVGTGLAQENVQTSVSFRDYDNILY